MEEESNEEGNGGGAEEAYFTNQHSINVNRPENVVSKIRQFQVGGVVQSSECNSPQKQPANNNGCSQQRSTDNCSTGPNSKTVY